LVTLAGAAGVYLSAGFRAGFRDQLEGAAAGWFGKGQIAILRLFVRRLRNKSASFCFSYWVLVRVISSWPSAVCSEKARRYRLPRSSRCAKRGDVRTAIAFDSAPVLGPGWPRNENGDASISITMLNWQTPRRPPPRRSPMLIDIGAADPVVRDRSEGGGSACADQHATIL
jgi:hypothetical protein